MKTNEIFTGTTNKTTGLKISFAIHLAILVIALIPMMSSVQKNEVVVEYTIPIEFAELSSTSNAGLQARSPKPDPIPKPVVEKEEVEPSPVEAPEVLEIVEIKEEIAEVESDIVEETVEEIVAAENDVESEAETSSSDGGSDATLLEGDLEGTEIEGDEEGNAGLDGDGVLSRRIIFRKDITKVAEQSGVIAVNVCVDRNGRVTDAKYNEEYTTIEDLDLVKRALYIASDYRFEVDYSAPKKECGMLTFIFDVPE